MANPMVLDPALEQHVRKIAREEMDKSVESIQLSLLKEHFLTRDEFLDAMERIDKRFEAMDKRFEAMDKRFEAMQQQMDKRFEAMQQQMDKRFEAMQQQMDKRFEAMQQQMDKRFDGVDKDLKTIRVSIDSLGERSGRALEETILELLRDQLLENHVEYTSIEREELVDTEGKVFFSGFRTDVDVVAKGSDVTLFEVKYHADQRDVAHFLKVAELYAAVHGIKPRKLYVVSLEIASKTLKAIATLPVDVIAGKVVI